MAQTPGDDKTEPSLELPSLKLPGLGRKRRRKAGEAEAPVEATEATAGTAPAPAETLEDPTPADVALGGPYTDEPTEQLGSWDRDDATERLPLNGTAEHAAEHAVEPAATKRPRRVKAERTRPVLPGWLAAALTGLLVGAAGAAGTYGAMAGCEVVRGVSTCGGAPGFFILVAIVALMVLLGAGLLKAFRVKDAGSTSFLAVGIVTVLVMLLLLDAIFSVWMFAVIPALTAAAYLLAHWVTTRFESEDTGRRDWT
ncbi:MAG TPA: hypothetical protein VFY11_16500 [Nocardioidaceae bacterium]|nr:hypothetical protein [Nocardioidaceae bacterium]